MALCCEHRKCKEVIACLLAIADTRDFLGYHLDDKRPPSHKSTLFNMFCKQIYCCFKSDSDESMNIWR